jgi:hypothetical protein
VNKENPDAMDPTALYYALSTIAQCAAALAALIGFLGLWRLDRLQEERTQAAHYLRWMMYREHLSNDPQNAQEVMILSTDRLIAEAGSFLAANAREESDARLRELLEKFRHSIDIQAYKRWNTLPDEQRRLMHVLRIFLMGTLSILVLAIVGIPFVGTLHTWPWTFTILIILASVGLGVGLFYFVREAACSIGPLIALILLLALTTSALAGSVRCTTYEERSLGRLQTVCDDGTRAVPTWNRTLSRWESTVTPPPGKACTGRLNSRTHQWEGSCR